MLSVFPRDVLDEIWDLIESVSEAFPSLLLKCTFDLKYVQTISFDLSGYFEISAFKMSRADCISQFMYHNLLQHFDKINILA